MTSELENPDQAYREFPGPILLLAGPGTGKTWQLNKRVRFLLEDRGAKPEEIAFITYTVRAAQNMRNSLAAGDSALPRDMMPGIIATMHSLINSIIGSNPEAAGLDRDYTILHDDNIRRLLFQDAAVLAGVCDEKWKEAFSYRTQGIIIPSDDDDINSIIREYEHILHKCAAVDFDGQIVLACRVLNGDTNQLAEWRKRTKYLLIDEYQDINEAQCELIRLLVGNDTDGLFAVGDDDQSIYSFRGGDPKYIRDFDQYFEADAKIGRLSKSWRCPENILRGAQAVVSKFYPDRVKKPAPTFGEAAEGDRKITIYNVPSDSKEAEIIAGIANEKIDKSNSVIILIRNKNYFPPIKAALRARKLNYNYKSDVNSAGIVRFAAVADWADDPANSLALRYLADLVIHSHETLIKKVETTSRKITEKRKVASKEIALLWRDASKYGSLYESLCARANEMAEGHFLVELAACLHTAKNLLDEKGNKGESLPQFLHDSGLLTAPGKNPAGLIREIREYKDEQGANQSLSANSPIRVYNMQSSKGLEADVVMVIGLEDGHFPGTGDDWSEASRLMYVAMTRAKRELYLFSARRRSGSISFAKESFQLKPSPFVDAIPNDYRKRIYIKPKPSKSAQRD